MTNISDGLAVNEYATLPTDLLPASLTPVADRVAEARGIYSEAATAYAEADRAAHDADEDYRRRILEAARLGKSPSEVVDDRAMKRDRRDAATIAKQATRSNLDRVWREYRDQLRTEVPTIRERVVDDSAKATASAVAAASEALTAIEDLLPLSTLSAYLEAAEGTGGSIYGPGPVNASRVEVSYCNESGDVERISLGRLRLMVEAAARMLQVNAAAEARRRERRERETQAAHDSDSAAQVARNFSRSGVIVESSADDLAQVLDRVPGR